MDLASDTVFRQTFEAKLQEYEAQHQGSQRKPWTQEKINEVIIQIGQARMSMNSKQRRTAMEYYWMSKYDVMTTGNEYHLIFKKKKVNDPTVLIIPREQYFGLIKETHESCGHGGRDKIIHALKTRYYVPKKAIEIFVALCPTCETKKNTPKKGIRPFVSQDFNNRGQFELMDFQSCPDGDYKWLLNYQDCSSKFLSLRPLKSKKENEVALELLKIFMTFGAPYVLQSESGRKFTAKVIEELAVLWPHCQIVHGKIVPGSVEKSNQNVENMLRSWMSDNKSSNWSLGCHFVQYKKNTSIHCLIETTPYKALFGINSKSVPRNIETESPSEQELGDNASSLLNTVPEIECDGIDIAEHNTEKPDGPRNLITSEKPLQANDNLNGDLIVNGDSVVYKCEITEKCDEPNEDPLENVTPDVPIDYLEPQLICKDEIVDQDLTCIVCNNACTNEHCCNSCGNAVHAICGLTEDKNGSKILCLLCKSELFPRYDPYEGPKKATDKIIEVTAKKVQVGSTFKNLLSDYQESTGVTKEYSGSGADLVLKTDDPTQLVHEGFRCMECSSAIIGFRYSCVECGFESCGVCEARGVHYRHYVLRVPGPRPHSQTMSVLQRLRDKLMPAGDSPPQPNETVMIKTEPVDEIIPDSSEKNNSNDSQQQPHLDNRFEKLFVQVEIKSEPDEDAPKERLYGSSSKNTQPQTLLEVPKLKKSRKRPAKADGPKAKRTASKTDSSTALKSKQATKESSEVVPDSDGFLEVNLQQEDNSTHSNEHVGVDETFDGESKTGTTSKTGSAVKKKSQLT